MISKSNVLSPTYLKLIAKKKKAIHSGTLFMIKMLFSVLPLLLLASKRKA
jgi:hypothetical protein